jgi:copper chaperone
MKLQLKVPNMACSACGDSITKAVKTVDPAATVQADTTTKFVHIETQAAETAITEAITAAGYTVKNN